MSKELALQQKIGYVDPAAVAAAESVKAMVQARFIMALQKPRDFDEVRDAILSACKRPAFAEKAEFRVKRGSIYNKATREWEDHFVPGLIIRFAEMALREWRNCSTEVQVVFEDADTKRLRLMVLYQETNAAFTKEIAIKKIVERKKADDREVLGERLNSEGKTVYIVRATEDEIQNKENAMISKVIRNEGLRLIPADIKDEATEITRETLRNRDSKDPDGAKKKILDSFSSLGVKPAELKKFLGHGTDILSPKELEDLRGIYRAIKDGEASWADYISQDRGEGEGTPPIPELDNTPALQSLAKEWKVDWEKVQEFAEHSAATNSITKVAFIDKAVGNPKSFFAAFGVWMEKQEPAKRTRRTKAEMEADEKKAMQQQGKPPEPPQDTRMGQTAIQGQDKAVNAPGGNSGPTKAATAEQMATIYAGLKEKDIAVAMVCHDWEVKSLEELDVATADQVIKWIETT